MLVRLKDDKTGPVYSKRVAGKVPQARHRDGDYEIVYILDYRSVEGVPPSYSVATPDEAEGKKAADKAADNWETVMDDAISIKTLPRACLQSLWYVELRLILRQGNHVSFLPQRHQPGAIRPDSSHVGVGSTPDQAPHRGPVRCFLRGAVSPEKRLPVANAACRLPRLAHLLQVFPAMERAARPG